MQEDDLHQNIQNAHDAKNDSDGQAAIVEKPGSAVQSMGQAGYGGVDFLSVAELSRRLGLPESSTRFYCKRFAAYLPHLGEGRRRRYSPQTLDVLRRVLFLMAKNKDARGVEKELPKYFPKVGPGIPRESAEAITGPIAEHGIHDESGEMGGIHGSPGGYVPLCSGSGGLDPDKILSLLERQTLALEGMAAGMNALCAELRSKPSVLPVQDGAEGSRTVPSAAALAGEQFASPVVAGQEVESAATPESGEPVESAGSVVGSASDSAVDVPVPLAPPALDELRRELNAELQSVKRLVSSLENTQQEDLQQLRDWLGRLAQELRQKTSS